MFPFWEIAIKPVLGAVDAKRVVEIGALRGETTVLMLEQLGPDSEFHVIDPVPEFDPAEHEKRFGGRYIFHRGISHDVLPTLGAVDVALIDGDHNWYTVYHELRMLRESARAAGEPLPVIIMHDVCWPYGRRDLYYTPERIPEEFRQPHRRDGMRPGRKKLGGGGLNATLANAEVEGGPRNGVMTALDDFMEEHDRPLRRVVLPVYFGLAIVVEEDRLARHPELVSLLDRLEGAAGQAELARMAETVRLDAAMWEQNGLLYFQRKLDTSTARYLDLLKATLLDEHYIENEVRIVYLADSIAKERPPDPAILRDPARYRRGDITRRVEKRAAGTMADDVAAWSAFAPMGRAWLDRLEESLAAVLLERIPGDFAECGVGRAGGAIFMRGFLAAHDIEDRTVWIADRFRVEPSGDDENPLLIGYKPDLAQVQESIDRFGLMDDRVRFLQGEFDHSLADAPIGQLAILRIGGRSELDVTAVLERLYHRVSTGGFVVVDDYSSPTTQAAVDAFRLREGITAPIDRLNWKAASWRKEEPVLVAAAAPGAQLDRAPLSPSAPRDALDLSVVVVMYNMRRAAARTLHSLSRTYQRGIDDLRYEVIVLENGSAADERLGEEYVRSFGPEFRYLDLGDEALSSPTVALNHGVRVAAGRNLALMIDGAHVLTPGVLRHGMAGLSTYGSAIVLTQQWYVGPGQQPEVVRSGYDLAYEDDLFEQTGWPVDGYKLFEIGHFIGDRDWLDGILESNCLFAPRSLLEQVGGFDDSFSAPGGGFANLELYERLGSVPGVTIVSILGEGSFHQVHGGTTTNLAEALDRRTNLVDYGQQYVEMRGRPIVGPLKHLHFVGSINTLAAARTHARRMMADAFGKVPISTGPDGMPDQALPIPDDLRVSFVNAFWRSLAWTRTTWLGHVVPGSPADLVAYQELIAEVRPDWVIEIGTGNGGRSLFLASICEMVGHGQVVSVDHRAGPRLPEHDRLTYVKERSHSDAAFARVREIVGEGARALLVLGRGRRNRVFAEFEGYSDLVPQGSYVVVTDTIVNGHPVWTGFGPGPAEAARRILETDPRFMVDTSLERSGLTMNPGGFLKRVR